MVRELNIIPVLNGFVVQAGCQKLVFANPEQLSAAVLAYYRDPEKVEAEYKKNAVNKTLGEEPMPLRNEVAECRPRTATEINPPLLEPTVNHR